MSNLAPPNEEECDSDEQTGAPPPHNGSLVGLSREQLRAEFLRNQTELLRTQTELRRSQMRNAAQSEIIAYLQQRLDTASQSRTVMTEPLRVQSVAMRTGNRMDEANRRRREQERVDEMRRLAQERANETNRLTLERTNENFRLTLEQFESALRLHGMFCRFSLFDWMPFLTHQVSLISTLFSNQRCCIRCSQQCARARFAHVQQYAGGCPCGPQRRDARGSPVQCSASELASGRHDQCQRLPPQR